MEQLRRDVDRLILESKAIQESINEMKSIKGDIHKMHEEVKMFNVVLKGFDGFKGVYDRLVEAEKFAKDCDDKNDKCFSELRKEIDHKFEILIKDMEAQNNILLKSLETNNTAITAQLVQLNAFRSSVLAILNIFKSKNFWKLLVAALGLISFGKSYHTILSAIGKLIEGITK